jgi:hypothetical protein
MKSRLLLLLLCLVGVVTPFVAESIDLNLAGTLQLDYLFTPFARSDPRPASHTLDGFTEELSLKIAVDISRHASANVKACFGCHGFEVGMAYVDFRLADEFNVRVGRFSPTFGEFGLRHDPGNHRLSDKPLPYDMGRMLRMLDFGRSVLPSPYVDNGIELSGSHFFGRRLQLDYAAHAVAGLRANTDTPYDVDFIASRSAAPYYIDNNSQPSVGGRVGVTARLADRVDLSVGGSVIWGAYDTRARMAYTIVGADLYLRAGRTNVRAEYLIRRTDMYAADQERFEYALQALPDGSLPERTFQTRDGWYVEVEQPVLRNLDVILRWDGLRRRGNTAPGSVLDFDAGVSRWTLGAQYVVERGYRLKASVQHYSWWGFRNGVDQDWAFHLGAVATF